MTLLPESRARELNDAACLEERNEQAPVDPLLDDWVDNEGEPS